MQGDGILSNRSLEVARTVFPAARVTKVPNSSHSSLISNDKVIDIIRGYGGLC